MRLPCWLRFSPQPDSFGFHQSEVMYGSGGQVELPGTSTAFLKMPLSSIAPPFAP